MRTINNARPGIHFVLLEEVVLWPYDGKLASVVAYPATSGPISSRFGMSSCRPFGRRTAERPCRGDP